MANTPVISKNTEKDDDKTKATKHIATRELSQLEINIIEERLTLAGGTLPQEIGGAIANRIGKALKLQNDATTKLSYIDKVKDTEERKRQSHEILKSLKEAQALRQEEVGRYTKVAMDYIASQYGTAKKNPNGTIIQYGDNIEVLKNRHLKKIW